MDVSLNTPSRLIDLKVELMGEPEFIKSDETREKEVMFLSNLDQVVLYPIETVYFFKLATGDSDSDTEGVVERLRGALKKLLDPYYFMAGRLQLNKKQFRLELVCNNAGVLFVGASSSVTLGDIGNLVFANPGYRSLVLHVPNPPSLANLPLTTIQVTRFKCGGFTLGFSSNHALLDGIAAGEFLANYASIARGEAMGTYPKPDRTMLKARSPLCVEFDHFEYAWEPGVPFSYQEDPSNAYTEVDALNAAISRGHALTEYEYKAFHADGKLLGLLKDAAKLHSNGRTCSSFEALIAHFWQCRTAALEMKPNEYSSLLFAVDLRQLLKPALPLGFAGNAVHCACPRERVDELLSKPLWFAIQKVQEARALINDKYARSAIDCLESMKGVPLSNTTCYVSAWWKIIKLQSLDFGWGPPIHAGPILSAMVEFVLFISDGTPNGLIVLVAMPPKSLAKFCSLFLQVGPNNTFFPC